MPKTLRGFVLGAAFVLVLAFAFVYRLASSPTPYLTALIGWWAWPVMVSLGLVQTLVVLLAWGALERLSPRIRGWTAQQRARLAGEGWRRVRERGCLATGIAVGMTLGAVPATFAVLALGAGGHRTFWILLLSHVVNYAVLVGVVMAGFHAVC